MFCALEKLCQQIGKVMNAVLFFWVAIEKIIHIIRAARTVTKASPVLRGPFPPWDPILLPAIKSEYSKYHKSGG